MDASKIKVGDTFEESIVDDLSRTQLVQYAGASGDYNPLHTDDVYAREAAGYRGMHEVEIFSAANWWKRDPDEVLLTCQKRHADCT